MYSIIFYPIDKKEQLIKPGFLGTESWIPLGHILSSLLKIEKQIDIHDFIDKFICNSDDLLTLVQYDSYTGKALKHCSKDIYSTIIEEKRQISRVLELYTELFPLPNKKFPLGNISNDEKDDDLLYQMIDESAKYMRISNILTEHALGRLSEININISSRTQTQLKKVTMITHKENKHGDISSTQSSLSKKHIAPALFYMFSTNDFFSLPWLELIEIFRTGALISTCTTCKQFFFDAKRKTKSFCSECGPKSLNAKEKNDVEKAREKEWKSALQYIRRNKLLNEQAAAELKKRGFNKEYKPRKKGKKGVKK